MPEGLFKSKPVKFPLGNAAVALVEIKSAEVQFGEQGSSPERVTR